MSNAEAPPPAPAEIGGPGQELLEVSGNVGLVLGGVGGRVGRGAARGLAGERGDGVGGAGQRGRTTVDDGSEAEGRRRGRRGDGSLVAGERADVERPSGEGVGRGGGEDDPGGGGGRGGVGLREEELVQQHRGGGAGVVGDGSRWRWGFVL